MSGETAPMTTDRHAWGRDLERARLAAGMKFRKDLAAASGVHKATIDALETGARMPRQDTLAALRRVLPNLPVPLEVTPDSQGGFVVHLPMDPDERLAMLAELMQQTIADRHRT